MSPPLRILILEDDPADAELTVRELRRSGVSFDWFLASSEEEYIEAIDPTIDVILADYALPGFNALAALDHLKRRGLRIPFIIVTGMLGDEAAVDCVKQGATDYLLKDRLKRLGPAVTRAVEDHRSSLERARAEERLRLSQQQAAEALRRANARLEECVTERTLALTVANDQLRQQIDERKKTEDQLRQAQKMEAVGQLTGGIAHDFNNLLTSILGNLDLALRKDLGEPVAKLLIRATQAAERGARLTSQLLAFGRRQALIARPVDLNTLIDQLRPMLISTLTSGIDVRQALDPELWPAHADPTQIELALLNLAINARDAMPLGGTITIGTRNVAADDPVRPDDLAALGADYVALVVRDDGSGMTPEVSARAFEPFFTTKEIGKGSGLGLSMAYGVAKQLGGTVSIESELGRGTSVTVYLPRATATQVAQVEAAPITAAQAYPRSRPVLVVDDDLNVRDTTASALREYGYEVIEADNAMSALVILDGGREIDVLVTDLVMPGMRGSELAIEARLRRPKLPVILITGYMGSLPEPGHPELHYPVLQKPFRPAELAAMVAECRRA
jgi:signal transduction histidine kinase